MYNHYICTSISTKALSSTCIGEGHIFDIIIRIIQVKNIVFKRIILLLYIIYVN